MLRLVLVLFASFRAALYSRTDLVIENLALRQQLAVLAHTGRRGRLTGADRLFWVMLRRVGRNGPTCLSDISFSTETRSSAVGRSLQRRQSACARRGPPTGARGRTV